MAHRLLIECRLAARREIAPGIAELSFAPSRRAAMPAFEPGAHVNLRLPGIGLRAYSLSGDPQELSRYTIAVKRERDGRGGSDYLHVLRVGDPVLVSHPTTTFALAPEAAGHLMIAGGVGVTPFLAMLAALARRDAPHRLHLALRERGDWPAHPVLSDALARGAATLHVAGEGPRMDVASLLAALSEGWHAYACGPERMLDMAIAEAAAHGLGERLHVEHFKGVEQGAIKGAPFEIHVPSRKMTVEVAAHETAAEALGRMTLPIATSCGGGVCRTCVVRWLSGEPIHRDRVLSPKARQEEIALCVSRARGRLVLDL